MRAIEPRRVFGALVRALEDDPEARAWVLGHKAEVMGWIEGRVKSAPEAPSSLWERFHATVPAKGRRPDDLPEGLVERATDLLDTCDAWMDEPEGHAVWVALGGEDPHGHPYHGGWDVEDTGFLDPASQGYLDLFLNLAGLDDTQHDRAVARFAWRLAMESDEERWTGEPYGDPVKLRRRVAVLEERPTMKARRVEVTKYRDDTRDGPLPRWMARAILADRLAEDAVGADKSGIKLRVAPVARDEAAGFIAKHHSKLPKMPARTMYALGAFRGDRLVAVATAGHPSAPFRRLDQRNVLELTRIASDGTTEGAASMLASRLIDVAPRSKRGDPTGPWLFVTYSLSTEDGAVYAALADKGLRPVEVITGKSGPQGARSAPALGDEPKIRWEAGPAALPALEGFKGAPSARSGPAAPRTNPAPAILGVDLGPNGGAVLLHPNGHVLDAWSWSWDEASKGGRLLTAESRGAGHHVQDLRAVGTDIGQRARRAYPGPIRIRAEVPWGNGAADLPKGQGGALDTLDGLTRALPGATVQRIGPLDWARPLGIARSAQDMARERTVYVRLQEWIARSGLRLPALYRRIRHVQDALAIAWTGR